MVDKKKMIKVEFCRGGGNTEQLLVGSWDEDFCLTRVAGPKAPGFTNPVKTFMVNADDLMEAVREVLEHQAGLMDAKDGD